MGKRRGIIMIACMFALLWTVIQICAAGNEEEVEKLFDDFSAAYRSSDLELIKKVWSHEDDVRSIATTPPGRSLVIPKGWNRDARGWDGVVEHHYDVIFGEMHVTGSFENVVIQVQGDKASATFDATIWGIPYKEGIIFFRKEDGEWKVYMCDFDNIEATRSGDESGEYVEIAFEAEDAEGVEGFLRKDADASGEVYVTGRARLFFKFNVPKTDEYTIWCRTFAPQWSTSYYSAKVDDIEFCGWGAICRKWTWSQLNQEGIKGPKTFELNVGEHSLAFSSPMAAGGMGHTFGDCSFDAFYITNNLSLRAEQIQRRFDLTMGYIAEPTAIRAKGKLAVTWARVKN